MTAGVPGTGITAIFYLLLVLLMPFRELYLMARGRGKPGRWRVIAVQSALAWTIIAALWLQGWLLAKVLNVPPAVSSPGVVQTLTHNVLTVSALATALFTFLGVVVAVQVLRLLFGRATPPPIASIPPTPAAPIEQLATQRFPGPRQPRAEMEKHEAVPA